MGIVAVAWFGELSMKPLAVIVLVIAAIAAGAILIAGFRMGRIDAWLDPWAYASDEGYQIVNSFYALADGGVSGVGLGMSHQKYLYLPQPHNDLIFPIIGEELGLIGAVSVVLLFLLFLFAAYRIAHYAPDLHGRVIAGAAASMIGVQAFLNMLCMVNLLPMTGKPLPFFSAGGSSIIVTLMLVGLVINVSLRSTVPDEATERRDQLLIIEGGRAAMPGVGQSLAERWARWQPARAQGTRAQETQMPGAKTPGAKRGFRKPPAPTQAAGKQPSRAAPARKGKPVAQPPRTQASHAQTSHAQTSHAQMPSRRARSPIYNPVRDSVPPAGVDARRPVVVNSQRSRYR
jgi:cell division protein FtsW